MTRLRCGGATSGCQSCRRPSRPGDAQGWLQRRLMLLLSLKRIALAESRPVAFWFETLQ